jgi:hypothetical protein
MRQTTEVGHADRRSVSMIASTFPAIVFASSRKRPPLARGERLAMDALTEAALNNPKRV